MGICDNCLYKDECLIELDSWAGCALIGMPDTIEVIINKIYDIIDENIDENIESDDYTVLIGLIDSDSERIKPVPYGGA